MIDPSEIINYELVNQRIQELMALFDLAEKDVDIVIPFGFLSGGNFANEVRTLNEIEARLINFPNYRSRIISSGSFPVDVTALAIDTVTDLPRHELTLFRTLVNNTKTTLTYADFGNIHCIYDSTKRGFEGSASLKYTTNTAFKIFRGRKPSEHEAGFGQYINHCKALVALDEYDGRDFSYGDEMIDKYANEELSGNGNATSWITITLNHHLTKVAQQVIP